MLGSTQALPAPGRCELGAQELELHPTAGHTADGMAIWIPWAGVLIAGDYLSSIELPTLGHGGDVEAYLATLERLEALVRLARHVVPGHGPVLDGRTALSVLTEDRDHLLSLRDPSGNVELPSGRRGHSDRPLK
jgi:glyoxylase-like metal-dependent hydrolase (beta-lactamase superfamily II)